MSQYLACAIDGGGVLGSGPALLAKLLNTKFKAYGGTSVGSLLASLFTFREFEEADRIFMEKVNFIFHDVPWWWKADPTRPKWQNDGLIKAANEVFGDLKMSSAPNPLFICASDFVEGKVKVYDRGDSDRVADVVVNSCSAPTYFPPLASRWADGGIVANNPSVVLATGLMRKEGIALDTIRMLSLATGGTHWADPKIGARMLELQWASPVIHFGMQASLMLAHFQAQELLGENYMRLDPMDTEGFSMDNLKAIPQWRSLWQKLWDTKSADIQAFVRT